MSSRKRLPPWLDAAAEGGGPHGHRRAGGRRRPRRSRPGRGPGLEPPRGSADRGACLSTTRPTSTRSAARSARTRSRWSPTGSRSRSRPGVRTSTPSPPTPATTSRSTTTGTRGPTSPIRWTFKDHYRSKDTFLYATGPVTSLDDENLNYYQTYRLVADQGRRTRRCWCRTGARSPRPASARARCPSYATLRDEAVTDVGHGTAPAQSFAGQADDPFFLDLRVFDLLYGGDLSEAGDDTLAGFNVNSVALQVPSRFLAKGGSVLARPRGLRVKELASALVPGLAQVLAGVRTIRTASASAFTTSTPV